jgi:HK97 family phage portal protein
MANPFKTIARGLGWPERAKSSRLTPDGLPITEFPAPVTQLLRLYGLAGTHSAIYGSQPNVRTVVDDIAREAAVLSMKMYMKDPRGPYLPGGRHEVSHPMMDLLDEPAPGLSLYRFWFALFADIGIYDRAIWRKIRNGSPKPKALLRIPPENIVPQYDPKTGLVVEWRAFDGTRLTPEELVVFWGYDPAVNHGSISPMETLRRLLSEEAAAGADREGRWSNSLRKDGVIEQASDAPRMSDQARESFLVDVEDSLSGSARSARPLLLEPGQSWKDVQWSPREMEYLGARKLNRTEVAAAYHYPAAKVLAGESGDPSPATLQYFYTSTLPPYLTRVEHEIEAQLLPDFETSAKTRKTFYLEFNLDAKLRGSFEQQAAIMATTAGGPVVLVNEARARLNLPPIDGGDKIFVPLNSMQGGGPQASPQSPVDTPAIGVNPAGTTPSPAPSNSPNGNGNGQVSRLASAEGALVMEGKTAQKLLSKDADDLTIEQMLAHVDLRESMSKARISHEAYLRGARERYEGRHAAMLEKYFGRQANVWTGGKALDTVRWDKELGDDLLGVSLQTVEAVGTDAAKRISGSWSTERTLGYMRKHATESAKRINTATQSLLKSGSETDAVFGEGRITELARSLTTFVMNWGTSEAAHQNDADVTKTWLTTSGSPRTSHAALDGETVGIKENFSNGLRFPGDMSAGLPDEVANCACVTTLGVG